MCAWRDCGADPCRSHLPESSAGIGTLTIGRIPAVRSGLPRFLRAGPSTSLDKSDSMQLLAGTIAEKGERCQAVNVPNVLAVTIVTLWRVALPHPVGEGRFPQRSPHPQMRTGVARRSASEDAHSAGQVGGWSLTTHDN